MLLKFTVGNYGCLRDESILSLIPSSDKEHPENIVQKGSYQALNLSSIYGANASGKSTLIRAMMTAVSIVRRSNEIQKNAALPVTPFLFHQGASSRPSHFEFSFVAESGIKYLYGFYATPSCIQSEYLYCYRSAKSSLIFEREGDNQFKFSRCSRRELEPLVRMNTPNKLFLATATAWNAKQTAEAFEWFSEGMDVHLRNEELSRTAMAMYRDDWEEERCFARKLMEQADLGIRDFDREMKEDREESSIGTAVMDFGGNVYGQNRMEIIAEHVVKGDNQAESVFRLPFHAESQGTQMLFYLSPFLRRTFEKGKILAIDELDRSLHPHIVKYLVNLFRDPEFNSRGAQLVFTTHETSILSLEIFRRDQIIFMEKDSTSGEACLYPLNTYSVRKSENIEKGYLMGRYGAVPFLQTGEII